MPAPIRRRPPAAPAVVSAVRQVLPTVPEVDINRKLVWEYVDINDIEPYEWNPRDNSKAVPAVANSIRSFGFLIPCVLDANNILVAGHTRVEAAKSLGMTEVPCVRAGYLTAAQVNAFRLIDNKVAEQATWDFDMLAGEIGKLSDLGLDFTQFGWKQEEIDCLSEVVSETCLTDTVNVSAESQNQVSQRRAPATARFVLGELVFFIPSTTYRAWVDGIRGLNNFDEAAITADLKNRLGILE